LEAVRITKKIRKYATVKQACSAYKELEAWPRKKVMSAINSGKIRTIDWAKGQELIDKIELDRLLRGIQ